MFITHLHDDHTTEHPGAADAAWTGSKATPTTVYGPYGTAALVDAAVSFLKANADIRIVDEGRTTRPEALYKGSGRRGHVRTGAGIRGRPRQSHDR